MQVSIFYLQAPHFGKDGSQYSVYLCVFKKVWISDTLLHYCEGFSIASTCQLLWSGRNSNSKRICMEKFKGVFHSWPDIVIPMGRGQRNIQLRNNFTLKIHPFVQKPCNVSCCCGACTGTASALLCRAGL